MSGYTRLWHLGIALLALILAGCAGQAPTSVATVPPAHVATATQAGGAPTLPRPAHVVVVMEENHSYSDIIGSTSAAYINALANQGALFTNSFAVTHPSQPNYLALFSGSTQGLTDDSCPHTFGGANVASELIAAGFSFTGYSESLPAVGYTGCTAGAYARKHSPWINFANLPSSANQPFSSFPNNANYSKLPTLSFVIPNLNNDMHDGTIQQADSWLKSNLDPYVQWARQHNSLLVVTWDEDDYSQSNQVPTIFVGQQVRHGRYKETIKHYNVLRTLEDIYGLSTLNESANVSEITDCWL